MITKRDDKSLRNVKTKRDKFKSLCNVKTKRDKFKSLCNVETKRDKFKSKKYPLQLLWNSLEWCYTSRWLNYEILAHEVLKFKIEWPLPIYKYQLHLEIFLTNFLANSFWPNL